jgi:branched-chain amino acid transport system substrate-binding protein
VTNKALGAGYTAHSKKQWNQQLGPSLALFDVGVAALKASGDPKNKTAVANAMKTLRVETSVGNLHWGKGPVPNVVQTPIPGGQWIKAPRGPFRFDWVFCEHTDDHRVPIQARLEPYS